MATVTLPDATKTWIDGLVEDGEVSSATDYLKELVEADRARRHEETEELRQIIAEARAGGLSTRTIADIRRDGLVEARRRGLI